MNDQDIARFEAQAAETVGAMKELFQEFERRLGEVVAAQRLASSEARSEAATARAALQDLARQGRAIAEAQRDALAELRSGWQHHVAENSKAAGAEMARTFGHQMAEGLRQQLDRLGADVDRVARRFEWVTALKWGAGIGVGIVLTIALGVSSLMPSAHGLSDSQVRAVMTAIAPCSVQKEAHLCVAIEPEKVIRGQDGITLAVIKAL
jgi:hypothetical protein